MPLLIFASPRFGRLQCLRPCVLRQNPPKSLDRARYAWWSLTKTEPTFREPRTVPRTLPGAMLKAGSVPARRWGLLRYVLPPGGQVSGGQQLMVLMFLMFLTSLLQGDSDLASGSDLSLSLPRFSNIRLSIMTDTVLRFEQDPHSSEHAPNRH